MKKRTRFAEQANNAKERRREDEDAANIFAVMQKSHHKQVNAIKEANVTAMQMAQMQMKTMAEQQQHMQQQMAQSMKMMTAMQSNQKQPYQPKEDKENNNPQVKGHSDTQRLNDAGKSNCPHCKRMVFHKPDRCLELERNADKRRKEWKSNLK